VQEVLPSIRVRDLLVPERTRVSEQATARAAYWSATRQIRQTSNTMRLPLEIAMEVGSFLDRPCLLVCTTQLCWNGVGFVSRPCTDSAKVTTIQLHKLVELCRTASHTLGAGQEQSNGLAAEAFERIDLCLTRRASAEKVVFVFDLTARGSHGRTNTDFYSDIHRHFQVSSNLQFNNGPMFAVEWHARAKSIAAVTFLLGETTGGGVNDGRRLALCQSLHALYLSGTKVSDVHALTSCEALHTLNLARTLVTDVSALASCQALHTLHLNYTRVSDVSALASCQALHTLHLDNTQVKDVSALASCQALHTLHLNNNQVSDVSALASCRALHTLYLDNTQVKDVSALASCQALHTLHLNYTRVSDVSALASCQALHTLYFDNTQVKDVSALAACQALHTLHLNNTQVSDVSALASCRALHTLYLRSTPVSDVSPLAACQALHTLDLNYTRVSDVSPLASCPALHTLRLSGTEVNGVSALAACGSLRYMFGCARMNGCGAIMRLLEDRRRYDNACSRSRSIAARMGSLIESAITLSDGAPVRR
jgi:Leucine-rich repeat (LRR) protein